MIKITTKKWGADETQRAIDYYCRDLDQRQDGLAAYYYGTDTAANWKNEWQQGSEEVFELCRGEMTKEAFAAAMMGLDTRTNQPLVEGGGQNHSGGIDFCFSVPKSVSLAYAAASSEEERAAIMGAIEDGNRYFLGQMKEDAKTRHGKAGIDHIGGVQHLAIASKTEPSSRNGDMQIHIHNNVMNLAIAADGSRRCLDYGDMLLNRERYEAEAGAFVFHRLKVLGYEIRTEETINAEGYKTGQVKHELNRVSQWAIDDNSSRQEEITHMMAERGVSKEYANKATKKNKQETSVGETLARAEAKIAANAQAYGFGNAQDLKGNDHQQVFKSDAELLSILHAGESAFTERQLRKVVAQYRGVGLGVDGAKSDATRMMEDLDLVPLKQNRHGERQWASRAYFNMEQKVLTDAEQMTQQKAQSVPREIAADAITQHETRQGFQMSAEQRSAAYGIACDAGDMAVMVGRAGTGKTTSIGAVCRAVEANGGTVYGASTADKAAAKLGEETGIDCYNTKKLLSMLKFGEQGRNGIQLKCGDKVLIDEAGMVGSQTIAEFQHYCRAAGASLLLVGDDKQIKPIEAGDPFRALMESGRVPVYQLTDIRRQKNEAELRLANHFYGDKSGQELRQELEKVAAVSKAATREDAIDQAAAYYANGPGRTGPIMATTNEDVQALNFAVRQRLKECGHLSAHGREVMGASLGQNSQHVRLEASAGDRVAFSGKFKDCKGNEVVRNSTGTIEGFVGKNGKEEADGAFMRVRLDPAEGQEKGRLITLDTTKREHARWNYHYAMTANKAQGQTYEASAVLLTKECSEVDRGKMLVLCTRQKGHQGGLNVFATETGLAGFERAAENFADKYNARELLAEQEPPQLQVRTLQERLKEGWSQGEQERERREAERGQQHQERTGQDQAMAWSL